MGILDALRGAVSFLRGRGGDAKNLFVPPPAAGLRSKDAALPAFYSLPWESGRARSVRGDLPVSELPRHFRGWVYAATRAIAQGCAASGVTFYAPSADATELPLPPTHPLPRLFAEVNPFHTYRELLEGALTDLELTGNAFWLLARRRVSGVPGEIWPVPPAWIRVVPGKGEMVRSYRLRRGGREIELNTRDVVHFRYGSPSDPFWGRSPLEAAMEAVRADESVARAQRRAFENGPIPGVIFKTREPLTADQQRRLRAEFESRFAGPDAAGRLIIVEEGREVVPFTTSPREMDFLRSARATRDRILGIFGVPPAVLGLVEDFNRANAEAAQMIFGRDTLLPKLGLLAGRITQDICSLFLPEGITCRFDSPVPADREAARRDMEVGVRLGVISPNEARADYYDKSPVEAAGFDTPRPVMDVVGSRSSGGETKEEA